MFPNANEDMTGVIGLEDSSCKPVWPQLKMLIRLLVKIKKSNGRQQSDKIQSLLYGFCNKEIISKFSCELCK